MDYVIAVPSYNRAKLFVSKTYALLATSRLLRRTTVFIVAEQEAQYRKELGDSVEIVIGKRGLKEQRQVIYDHYPEGTNIVMLDDDVEYLVNMKNEKIYDITETIERGIEETRRAKCRLWSIYPVPNPFFMKDTVTTDLRFCNGCIFGIRKNGPSEIPMGAAIDYKEDYFRTCAYYKKDGAVVRLNNIAAKQKYLRGDSLDASKEGHRIAAEIVVSAFPKWAKTYIRASTGYTEIRLKCPKGSEPNREA